MFPVTACLESVKADIYPADGRYDSWYDTRRTDKEMLWNHHELLLFPCNIISVLELIYLNSTGSSIVAHI